VLSRATTIGAIIFVVGAITLGILASAVPAPWCRDAAVQQRRRLRQARRSRARRRRRPQLRSRPSGTDGQRSGADARTTGEEIGA
jgi:hypothetical protein